MHFAAAHDPFVALTDMDGYEESEGESDGKTKPALILFSGFHGSHGDTGCCYAMKSALNLRESAAASKIGRQPRTADFVVVLLWP